MYYIYNTFFYYSMIDDDDESMQDSLANVA